MEWEGDYAHGQPSQAEHLLEQTRKQITTLQRMIDLARRITTRSRELLTRAPPDGIDRTGRDKNGQ